MKLYLTIIFYFVFFGTLCASELDVIINRNYVSCGLYRDLPGFSLDNNGFEVSFCQMMSTALFASKDGVEIMMLDNESRWDAIKNDEVDVLFANATWTMKRDIDKDMSFSSIYYHSKQGFMVLKSSNIRNLFFAPNESKVCATKDSTVEITTRMFLNKKYPFKKFKLIPYNTISAGSIMLFKGECDILAGKISILNNLLQVEEALEPTLILSEVILSPSISSVTAKNSKNLSKFLKIIINGTLRAEAKGITRKNIDELLLKSDDKEILFMFGKIKGIGAPFLLDDKWLYRIIKEYGNYGELFEDTLGMNSKYKLKRDYGLSSLYEDGGLFYTYPFY